MAARRDGVDHSIARRTYLLNRILQGLLEQGVVCISAMAGMGKTTLLNDVASAWAGRRGTSSVIVRVDASDSESKAFLSQCACTNMQTSQYSANLSATVERAISERRYGKLNKKFVNTAFYGAPLTKLVWSHLDEHAGAWVDACAPQDADLAQTEKIGPLILVDNVPIMDDESEMAQFAKSVRLWVEYGAHVVLASEPSADMAASAFPDMPHLSGKDLTVDQGELTIWVQDLCLPLSVDMLEVTKGIPALLDCCRYLLPHEDLARNGLITEQAMTLMERCIKDPAVMMVERIKWACILLGEGSFDDLRVVCGRIMDDDLAYVEANYQILGVDRATASFKTAPSVVKAGAGLFTQIIGNDAKIAVNCVSILVRRKAYARAHDVARLMPEGALATAMARHPDVFADLADDELFRRSVAYTNKFEGLYVREQQSIGNGVGILVALKSGPRAVGSRRAQAWTRSMVEAVQNSWHAMLPVAGRRDAGAAALAKHLTILRQAVAHAIAGDRAEMRLDRERVCVLTRGNESLAGLVALHHLALCAIVGGDARDLATWLRGRLDAMGLREALGTTSGPSDGVVTVSGALMRADLAFMAMLGADLGTHEGWREATQRIESSRSFLERKGIRPFLPAVTAMESFACLMQGEDDRALMLLDGCEKTNADGSPSLLGAIMLTARALSEMCRGKRDLANVSVTQARELFAGTSVARGVAFADVLATVVDGTYDCLRKRDGRLLELTLREQSEYPVRLLATELERAVLSVAAQDRDTAAVTFESFGRLSDPMFARLACLVLRGIPDLRERCLEVLPADMRRELELMEAGARHEPRSLPADVDGGERPLEVCMLGELCIRLHGHRIDDERWGREKSRILFMHLAVAPNQRISRDRASRLLWPASDPSVQRGNLSAVLSTIRRVLGQCHGGPSYLLTSGNDISLNSSLVAVDVEAFEREARTLLASGDDADPMEKLERYGALQQTFGSGLVSSLLPRDDVWARRARGLSAVFADCMIDAARLSVSCDRRPLARRFARAACDVRPTSPHALAVLLASEGDQADSIESLIADVVDGRMAQPLPTPEAHDASEPTVEAAAGGVPTGSDRAATVVVTDGTPVA